MNVPNGVWWQQSQFKEIVSNITDRRLYVNTSTDLFLIPQTFAAERVQVVAKEFRVFWRSLSHSGRPSPAVRPYLEKFEVVADLQEFGAALNDLMNEGLGQAGDVNKGRISDLLISLWEAECLALPRNCGLFLGRMHAGRQYWSAEKSGMLDIIRQIEEVSTNFHKTLQIRALTTIMLTISRVSEIGDLTPEVVDGMLRPHKHAPSTSAAIVASMKFFYKKDELPLTSNDYGPFGKQSVRNDNNFDWAVRQDASLSIWRGFAQEWMSLQIREVPKCRVALNGFFDALIADPTLPRDPLVVLSSAAVTPQALTSCFANRDSLRKFADFLDWVLATRCTEEDDNGHPYRLPGFRNPIDFTVLPPQPKHAESVREAMPTRFVRRLREIIVEDDYAWPKAAFGKKADYKRWYNHETSEWEDIWSPVRALAILLKLELPERTFQIRVCNSGEADEERYDFATDTWRPNDHPLAGQSPYGTPMGLPRRIKDLRVNNTFTGLYFNTNKTGDIGKEAFDRGHVIPWQNELVLRIADEVRRWQEKYNPVTKPTPWSGIAEMQDRYSAEILSERGAETFLFRDPCSSMPDHPVAHGRLALFWMRLCGELERRLEEEGETAPGGGKIELTTKAREGRASGVVYNLHSLRVTMITALAEAGVPVEILMKVAGHATAIMTIYYQKHSIAHVTQVLNDASAQMMLNEQGNWQAWLKSKSYDELAPLVAHNDPSGPLALFEASNLSVVRRDHGICPVGCSRCDEGGPRVEGSVNKKHHPVPGGAQNCVRCRFFITGPCFLLGLNAYFDEIGFRYREASRAYADFSKKFERLDYERKVAASRGEPFLGHAELERASSILDQRTREVDEIALTWHATYNLIQQALGLLRQPHSQDPESARKNALILVGDEEDLDYVLQLDDDDKLDFELLDKICQTSVFFKSIDATVPNLKRMRRFDSLLLRSGYDAIFVQMTEEDAIAAGNEFAQFLFTRFGRETTNQLMNGQRTLASLGLDEEHGIAERLSKIAPRASGQQGLRLVKGAQGGL